MTTDVFSSDLDARRLLTWYVVQSGRVVTVAEIVRWLLASGFDPPGRASKFVSDRLRGDVSRGRIIRVGRGRYRSGHVAPTTWRRIEDSATASIRRAGSPRMTPTSWE